MPGFGKQTVTAVHNTQASQDVGGAGVLTPKRTAVPGCLHEALVPATARGGGEARAQETPEIGVSVATAWWKTTCRPVAAIMELLPSDQLEVDGGTFQIIGGVHPFKDRKGRLSHVTILSEKQMVG